ncbi:hypothetical protein QA649_11280 [Bradyrhizobium sp. CB1717]|uniref:hypothetical protein n=1 Tax=Bradyrhizobium sp. CB1717 TaxID=3039154 RepID=UPI0024B054C3|nr:hypothetical protein [Bradyrhizobium sp. CB1717]WFU26759.1 hypothetical protein QA649_11280 [Bradyrhizobium sp. CB1717]
MQSSGNFKPTREDLEFASSWIVLNRLITNCKGQERATLLLSTCRNAYMTANALFAELQVILGDGIQPSGLRAGAELLIKGATAAQPLKTHFGRAIQTIREYEKKGNVWSDRQVIWADIEQAKVEIDKLDPLSSSRVEVVLDTPASASGNYEGQDRELLEINLQPRPHLDETFRRLDETFAVLKAAADLGFKTALALDRDPQEQLALVADTREQSADKAVAEITSCVLKLATACHWHSTENGAKRTIGLTSGHARPQMAGRADDVDLPGQVNASNIEGIVSALGLLVREAMYVAHWKLCDFFQPNVAKPPLPPLFKIRLPFAVADQTSGSRSRTSVRVVRCSAPPVADKVRIGLAHLAVPVKHLNTRSYAFDDQVAQDVADDVRRAIHAAAKDGCNAIAFPEYSLPNALTNEIHALANKESIVVIGGLEGSFQDGKLCARAIIAIPGESQPHFQYKQRPSLQEANGDAFFRDDQLSLFLRTPVGDFSVVVCSDFLELGTLQAWKHTTPLPDLVFVIARNDYPDLYVSMAKADAVRLYTCVAICNVLDDKESDAASLEGSCVIVPNRTKMELQASELAVEGRFLTGISVYEVPLHAPRARINGKPDQGFFAVPHTAQRK